MDILPREPSTTNSYYQFTFRQSTMATQQVLVDDVLWRTLCYCDISTVLIAGLASRTLHNLATSRRVWVALLFDLHRRGFIDLLPGQQLDELSAHELKEIAKRSVHGPKTWSPSSSSSSPNISPVVRHQIVLKASTKLICADKPLEVFAGGRFILFQTQDGFECRDIWEDKLVWQWEEDVEDLVLFRCAVDVVEDGRAVNIILGISTFDDNYIEVYHLDLWSKCSRSLHRRFMPGPTHGLSFCVPMIKGDFAVARDDVGQTILIVQLSTTFSTSFAVPSKGFELSMIPGYVMALTRLDHASSQLSFWSTQDLIRHDTGYGRLEAIAPATRITIDTLGFPHPDIRLGSNLSPLHRNSSIVWTAFYSERGLKVLVTKHRVSHPPSPLVVEPVSSWVRQPDPHTDRNFSCARFSHLFYAHWDHLSMLGASGKTVYTGFRSYIHLSTYSDALTYYDKSNRRIVIAYFE